MKFKLVVILLFFVISSSSISGEEPIYYTSYKSNNGGLCHGMHEGDKYYFERFAGWEALNENGTLEAWLYESTIITIEITEVDDGLTIVSDAFTYTYNITHSDRDYSERKFGVLNQIGSKNYFVYIDWNAWRNIVNNRTQANIDKTLEKYPIHYKAYSQTNTTFTFTSFSNIYGSESSSSNIYNKTDGSLISINTQTLTLDYGGYKRHNSWEDVRLVSKQKLSEENVCPDPATETISSDDAPVFNFAYLVVLIPVTRMKKSQN